MVDIMSYIDPKVAIVLWFLGAMVKHSKYLSKIKNELIPVILTIIGIVLNMALNGFTVDAAVTGFITSMFCVGVHKSGREIVSFGGPSNVEKEESFIPDEETDNLE